eukprot:2140914-Rhodomonas_salina.1
MLIGLDQWWAQTDDVLVLVLPLKDGMDFTHVHRQMGRAVFCPTPPGENPDGTPRFFMSVAAGCIPVMFAHPRRDGGISWHAENGARFEDTMPFSSVIDFHRLVVLVPSSVRDSRALAEYLAGVTEEEIRAKQAYGASVCGKVESVCPPKRPIHECALRIAKPHYQAPLAVLQVHVDGWCVRARSHPAAGRAVGGGVKGSRGRSDRVGTVGPEGRYLSEKVMKRGGQCDQRGVEG